MREQIPCKHCGRYYGHKMSCVSYLMNTGVADKIMYQEFKRRYGKELYDSEKRIKQLEDALRDTSEMVNRYVNDYMGEESETLDVAEFYYHKFDAVISKNQELLSKINEEKKG